ncbi:hypothetical protein Fmac_019523 [Flemingia macrophylla]|uniref:Uncharacterized protein n=1 Tax=Flemingia macrophylla TaxID=520843 RepID=A0ABD1M851_9FABA
MKNDCVFNGIAFNKRWMETQILMFVYISLHEMDKDFHYPYTVWVLNPGRCILDEVLIIDSRFNYKIIWLLNQSAEGDAEFWLQEFDSAGVTYCLDSVTGDRAIREKLAFVH